MGPDYAKLREEMVVFQLLPRGIRDPAVLASMQKVPRHLFVPEFSRKAAYDDCPQLIGEGQTISQPYIVALMTEAAGLKPGARVLEIGTGSGYAAAVAAEIAQEVYTIERILALGENAKRTLEEQGYKNVTVRIGDGSLGWAEKGPFDAILVTAGAPVAPASLLSQLAAGGRMVIPVGDSFSQELRLYVRESADKISETTVEYVRFVPLIGKEGW